MNVADISATIEEAKRTVLEQRKTIALYEAAFLEIHGILHSCIIQRAACDDTIIAENIEAANKIALAHLHGPAAPAIANQTEAILRFVMFGDRPR